MEEQRVRGEKVNRIPLIPIESGGVHGPGPIVWAWRDKGPDFKIIPGSEEINLWKNTDLTGCIEEGSHIYRPFSRNWTSPRAMVSENVQGPL